MINTFHSSYNPPPVPPRAGYSRPQPPGNTPMVKFLSVMLLLLMILTFGGFLYLFQKVNVQEFRGSYSGDLQRLEDCVKDKLGEDSAAECGQMIEKYKEVMAKISPANEKVYRLTGGSSFNGPVAYMVLVGQHKATNSDFLSSNYLLWDRDYSLLQEVELNSRGDILTIHNPGIYFIYSQVTFSKQLKNALMQTVKSRDPKKEKEKDKELLKSFCSLNPSKPNLCTASLMGVFRLQKDQQLYVTVTNTSFVNRDSCSFGLFKLR